MSNQGSDKDWELVQMFLPRGWQAQARKLGALQRERKISSPETLLRVLLIHLSEGCSLRETVTRARVGELCDISDVALLKRLRASSEWFRWIAQGLLSNRQLNLMKPAWLNDLRVRSVDATVVSEPGSTGTDWRLHYSLELFGLNCDEFKLSRQDLGESFSNFDIAPGDLVVGDRAYSRLKGLWYVRERGGHFLTRYFARSFTIRDARGKFDLHSSLGALEIGEIGDWRLLAKSANQKVMPIRLCAIRLSDHVAKEAVRRAAREARKKQRRANEKTIELHRYVILPTSLPETVAASDVMNLYRARWQVEIAFKRLKSIIGLGHLPKKDLESGRAWLHGKLLVALLVQAIVDEGRFFSPWGYPLGRN